MPESSADDMLAARFGVVPFPVPGDAKVGISRNAMGGGAPLHGLRHPPTADTSGWYIWADEELADDSDFFQPLHAEHLMDRRPEIVPYLGLPPGWRVLLAPGYEDVWFDPSLIS